MKFRLTASGQRDIHNNTSGIQRAIRNVSMRRVLSAGEAEIEPRGYQTETRHIGAGPESWD
jgi:hypothetical protein